jgi:D-proline reductase (dithiol) PrdB
VGLVARYLEEQGISTIILTSTPEFNREIGFPRTAAIQYPYGRPIGQVHDKSGQREVLLKTLDVLQQAEKPGSVVHLPFFWPEDPRNTKWHPPEISPLVKLFLNEIKKAGADVRS